ncbi:MAG: alpha/beta fold hydrolase [Rhodobacter sp.]|nr:alpha/beta fold hydrolase [Rhodobacter sp.]
MTLIPITATPTGLSLAMPGGGAPEPAIRAALTDLPATAPVVIMLHGKGYCPGRPAIDPHALIFAPRAGHGRSRFVSWPRRLGFALPGPHRPRGLCLAFGWESTGSLRRATAAADTAALMLARLVQAIRRADPGRRVDLIGHSLGARVILGAVPLLAAGTLDRVILLAGADFTDRARQALTSPAGQTAEFLNITTRENDLYDFLFERALSPLGRAGALGRGLGGAANWLDIQIDHPATEAALRALGLPLARPRARICHWSVYLRPGVFRLYRALLHDRARLNLPLLRAALATPQHPRWTRLVPARSAG